MSKYKFGIMHLPIKTYLKWWLDKYAEVKEKIIVGKSETNPAYLTNCLKRPLLKFVLIGKTEQGENPSPDNPQEIRNVAGTIQIKKCNKNKLDALNPTEHNNTTVTFSNDIIKVSSTVLNTTPIASWIFDNLKSTDTIRYSGIIQNSNGQIVLQAYKNNTWITIASMSSEYTDGITPATKELVNSNAYPKVRLLLYSSKTTTTGASESNYKNFILTINEPNMTYVPHAEKTYNFPLSKGQKLMQDGTIENKVVNEWGEIELDGSNDEGWERLYTDYFVTKAFENVVVDDVNTKCTIATIIKLVNLHSDSVNKFSVQNAGSGTRKILVQMS